MMRWIVGSSLKFRRLVVALAVGVLVLGAVQIGKTPVDVLPEFGPATVEVQTEALGLSAEEVEQLITVPLEQDLLVGVAFLDEIESVSLPGLSSVKMTFEPGTDILAARQVVQERLTQAVGIAGLPAVANTPQMIQPLSSTSRASMIKLTSQELSPIEMSVLARWVIGPRLLGVDGVANVAIWGNRDRQLQVQVNPEELQAKGVTLQQVIRTAGNALEVSPLSYLEASKPGTGGFIDTPNQRLNIFHEQAIKTADELGQVPLEGPNGGIPTGTNAETLSDVATVVEDHQPLIGDTACSGGESCLLLVVEKFPNTNTVEVAANVDAALAALRPGLADMQLDSSIYRPASYVESSFQNLTWAMIAGGILLLLLVGALFWDWRRSVIVVAGISVSITAMVLVLNGLDTTVNLVVVAGLALGLTVLIDETVSDSHGLARHLRQHRASGSSAPVWPAIVNTAAELRGPLFYAALIMVAATAPLFFLTGAAGAFLPALAMAYLLAVAVSLVVALTITPVLGMMLLSNAPETRESPVSRWMHKRYEAGAPKLLGKPGLALGVFGGIAVLGLASLPFLNTSMAPSLKERDVLVRVAAAPGTSLPRMTEMAAQAVSDIGSLPGVEDANAQIGRAIMSDRDVDVHEGEIWLRVSPDADYEATLDSVEETIAGYPEITGEVMSYSGIRVREVLQEDAKDVEVRVYGENATVLAEKAEEIQAAMADVDGITQVNVQPTPMEDTVEVQVDLDKALALGMKPGDIRRSAAILLGGITVGNLFETQKVFDVVVWGAPEIRQDVSDIENLLIDTPEGGTVRLGAVADVRNVPNAAVIRHESVASYLAVTADVSGRSVADVNNEVDTVIDGIAFPLDHHAEVLPGFSERQAQWNQFLMVGFAALLAIFLLLQSAFRSWRLAALVFLSLPVSLAGGLVAALALGGTVSLGTIGGLLAVLGIAARGAVMMIRHLQHLERRESMTFGPELVVRGVGDRLAPMVLSALGAAALVLPIAVLAGATGFELLQPAAVTVLGGLVTTTVVNLFVLPTLYLRLGSVPDKDSWADELLETSPVVDPVRS